MRPEKASIVSDLSEKLNRSPFVLVTDYQRMNVSHFADLRNRLAASGAEVHVVKNSFLKRAMTDSGLPDVADRLTGQTAVVTGEKDVAPVAKILKVFIAEFKLAALKIGVVDKSILSTQELETLAELPSREVLLAQLLGLLLSPATKLVRLLNEPGTSLARLLNARASKMPTTAPAKTIEPEAAPESKEQPAADETVNEEKAPSAEEPKAEAPKNEAAAESAPAAEALKAEAPKIESATESAPAPDAAKEEKPGETNG
jgi:large subunit ribosomal protein L10